MDAVLGIVQPLWREYEWALENSDKRVADWPLMSAYWPTIVLTLLYLLFVWLGPKWMNHRPAFECRYMLFLYNAVLVVLNFHICSELVMSAWRLNYSLSCQLVHYGDNPHELRIAKAIWWYYVSKLIEFMDTIFFILRKKNSQVSFLHVYHHASMFPIWWIGVKWVPGGQAFFGATINSFIHVLMYSYYGLAALGPSVQKYLWWKKYLTVLQLIQFVVGMFHAAQSIFAGCAFPLWMQWALIIYGSTILSLFINFYIQAYVSGSKKSKTKDSMKSEKLGDGDSTKVSANGNHAGNSHIANGHRKPKMT